MTLPTKEIPRVESACIVNMGLAVICNSVLANAEFTLLQYRLWMLSSTITVLFCTCSLGTQGHESQVLSILNK